MTEQGKIIKAINEVFEYGGDNIRGIAEMCLSRVDDFSSEEDVIQSMNDALIYTDDQWEILKYYCDIKDANFYNAMEEFTNDLLRCADIINSL